MLSNRLFLLLLPFALTALMFWGLEYLVGLPSVWLGIVSKVPVALLLLALVLSLQFNRGRYSFLVMILLLAWLGLDGFSHWRGTALFTASLAVSLLVTVVLLLLTERSAWSLRGLWGVLLLGLLACTLLVLNMFFELGMERWLHRDLFAMPLDWAWLHIPDLILLLGSLCLLCSVTLLLKQGQSQCAVFMSAQISLLVVAIQPLPQWHGVAGMAFIGLSALLVCLYILLDSHDMAYRDELTGLPSRRALNQKLLTLGRQYSIAMMDIDHFKKFNDTHGHDVGDQVLQMVAAKMAKIKGGGRAYRYGGEEFTVVFPRKSPEQVTAVLEELRLTIQDYAMQVRTTPRAASGSSAKAKRADKAKRGKGSAKPKSLSVTISIGLAQRDAKHKTPEQVIKAADKALYRAKKQGRNCLSV